MPRKKRKPERRQMPLVPVALIALAALALVAAAAIILRPAPTASAQVAAAARTRGGSAPTVAAASGSRNSARSPERTPVTAEDGVVRLPTADFADGQARFYTYQGGAKAISFFVLQGSDGALRAAYDACDVCYSFKKGYHQEDDVMVCNNCGNRFPSVRINVETGGCNPSPLKMQVQGDTIVIQAADIEAGARYF